MSVGENLLSSLEEIDALSALIRVSVEAAVGGDAERKGVRSDSSSSDK